MGNLTLKMCRVLFEVNKINIYKLFPYPKKKKHFSEWESPFVFIRINNLKFLKNGTKRQIVMRNGEKNPIELHEMKSRQHQKYNNNQNECLIFKIGYIHFIQIKYYYYFHDPATL